jgi:hypothetical protein
MYAGAQQMASGGGGMGGAIVGLIQLAIAVAMIAGLWKVFTKAGHPGWAAIVPIYNMIVMLQIANKPIWWIILFFIPIVNIVIAILVAIEIAKRFNQGAGFGIGMVLLPFVFYPMLGFGSATYQSAAPGR